MRRMIVAALLVLLVAFASQAQPPTFHSQVDGQRVPVGRWLELDLSIESEETPLDGEVVIRGEGTYLKLSYGVQFDVLGLAGSLWCDPGDSRWLGQEACYGCGAGVLMDCRAAVATKTVTPNTTSASFLWPLAMNLDVGEYEVEARLDTDRGFYTGTLGSFHVEPYEDWWRW